MANIAQAVPAINTLIAVGSQGSPQVFNVIANVGDITGPGFSAAIVDVTSHSNITPWRSKVTTLLDAGDLAFKLFFVPSSPGTVVPGEQFGHSFTSGTGQIFTQRELREYSMTFPDPPATTWYIQGYISKLSQTASVAGVLEQAASITITYEPILV